MTTATTPFCLWREVQFDKQVQQVFVSAPAGIEEAMPIRGVVRNNRDRCGQGILRIDRKQQEATMANTKPIHQIRLGTIRAAIWQNQSERTGESWLTVTVTRSYRDKEQMKDTASFRRDDLPIVAKAVDLAYAWIWEQPAPCDAQEDESLDQPSAGQPARRSTR